LEELDFEHFKEKLLAARAEVLSRVRKTESYGRDSDTADETMDPLDQAATTYTKEFLFSLSNVDRKILQEIEEALERIKDGTYGVCLHSGEPIDRKRLEAVPWAKLSVKAQERVERGRF
jgi:DnaK suppressor protein